MKIRILLPSILLSVLNIAPALVSQETASPEKRPAAAAAAAPRIPAGAMLDSAVFEDAPLRDIVDFLEKRESEAGGRPLNIVLSPGIDNMLAPSLKLRNVTTTEVLAVTANLMDLKVEPIFGDEGERAIAWSVKPRDAAPAPEGAGAPFVTLAKSAGTSTASDQPQVFGVASLLPPSDGTTESENKRKAALTTLLENLTRFAHEHDKNAVIRPYPDLDLVLVKSTALPLIGQAIDAMEKNAGVLRQSKELENLRKAATFPNPRNP